MTDGVPASAEDFRRMARARLPRRLFDYLDGGAGREITLQANISDFENIRLRQRVLRNISNIQTGIELFGETLAMPVILAPIGMAGLMARRAEVQAKKVADRAGIPFTLSTMGICPIDEVARVSDKPAWFQIYMLRDRGIVSEILGRAWDNGVRTLVFTVDLNVLGVRYREIRNGMFGGSGWYGNLRAGAVDYALHPRWLWDVGVRGGPHRLGNIARYVPGPRRLSDFRTWIDSQIDGSISWKDIEWLRQQWKGNLVLKGILDEEDARKCLVTGADGLVVSNHGGRQLDGVASTAIMLPRIADALGNSLPLIVDGGIRSGQDIVKAVALGARAVMIGRPWIFALSGRGEAGLEHLLTLMRMDMHTALGLSGFPDVIMVDRTALMTSCAGVQHWHTAIER
ncbi:MAG: L-lactate dehydrogenase [Sphingomonadaceae bacterium]